MTVWYGFRGAASGELLTYQGSVLAHHDPDEALWLLAADLKPVRLSDAFIGEVGVWRLKDHPQLSHLNWPLNRGEFRDSR